MAAERRNPIPAGWYWVDVPDAQSHWFNAWLHNNRNTVDVHRTVARPAQSREWILFEVTVPTPQWSGPGVGFPQQAPRGASTRYEDTFDRPEPEPEGLEKVNELTPSITRGFGSTLGSAAAYAAIGAIAWVVWRHRK